MEALNQRLLDAIAVLLVLAPIANVYFVWQGTRRYHNEPGRSPILLALLIALATVWLLGLLTGILSLLYLIQPPRAPSTISGLLFGAVLLLVQALPHIIEVQMRRIERGHG